MDLQSLLSSGSNGFNYSFSNGDPFTTQVNKNQTVNTNSRSTQQSHSYSRNTDTNTKTHERKLQNVSDPVLALINQSAASLPHDLTLQTADNAKRTAAFKAIQALNSYDPNAAIEGASGNVADLSRNLLEQIMPQILGSVEASGTSNNALAALTANDAAIRTGEAQARVMEQARQNSVNELLNLIQGTTQAGNVGSSVQDAIVNLTNAAKGTVDQGFIKDVESRVQEALKNSTSTSNTTSTENTTGTTNTLDLQTLMDMSQSNDNQRLAKLAALQALLPAGVNMADAFGNTSKYQGAQGLEFGRAIGNIRGAVGI